MRVHAFPAVIARCCLALALLGGCTTTRVHGPSVEDEIRAVERERLEAMVAADTRTLDRLLAVDLHYGHSNGVAHSKPELLAVLADGSLDYVTLRPRAADVRTRGDTALVNGTLDMEAIAGSRRVQTPLRFLAVYERRDGRWQLVAYQSAAIAN